MIMRPERDVNMTVLSALSPEMKAAIAAAEKRPGMLFALTDQEALEHIEKIPGALGATSLNEVMAHASSLKALTLDGVAASPAALADGSYPVRHTYFLVTGREPSILASSFVNFVLSEPGLKILSESGHSVRDPHPAP